MCTDEGTTPTGKGLLKEQFVVWRVEQAQRKKTRYNSTTAPAATRASLVEMDGLKMMMLTGT